MDEKELSTLTELCRIYCSEEEKSHFLQSLQKVLSYIEQLKEVDTEGVAPCNHILQTMHNVMREDIAEPTLPREAFLANAPDHIGGMIRVPPVIKEL